MNSYCTLNKPATSVQATSAFLQSPIRFLRLSKLNDKEEGDFPVRETRGKGYLLRLINDFMISDQQAVRTQQVLCLRAFIARPKLERESESTLRLVTRMLGLPPHARATRQNLPPGLSGTKAWIVIPRLSWDSIESVPFRIFSRSSMLIRPSPRPAFAASTSKPNPESLTVR